MLNSTTYLHREPFLPVGTNSCASAPLHPTRRRNATFHTARARDEHMALSLATVLDRSLKEGIRRRQCEHATVYTHEELCAWIGVALPSWTVHGPSILGDNALAASWPCDDHVNNVEKWLSDNGCKDPANLLAGACEPLAVFCLCNMTYS